MGDDALLDRMRQSRREAVRWQEINSSTADARWVSTVRVCWRGKIQAIVTTRIGERNWREGPLFTT